MKPSHLIPFPVPQNELSQAGNRICYKEKQCSAVAFYAGDVFLKTLHDSVQVFEHEILADFVCVCVCGGGLRII